MLAIMVFLSFLSLTPLLLQSPTPPIGLLRMILTGCRMMRRTQLVVGQLVGYVGMVAMQVLVVFNLVVRVVLIFLVVSALLLSRRKSTLPL